MRLCGQGCARIAGLYYALYPPSVYYATNATCDASLVAFCLVAIVCLSVRLLDRPAGREAAVYGCVSGLSALINPSALSVAIPLLLMATLTKRGLGMRRFLLLALAVSTATLTAAPWLLRNRLLFDRWVFLRSNLGMEFRAGSRDDAKAFIEPAEFHLSDPTELARLEALGEPGYDGDCLRRAVQWIAAHPAEFARLCIARASVFWGKEVFFGSFPLLTAVCTGIPMLLAVVGFWSIRRSSLAAWSLLIPLLCYPIVYYLTHAQARFRFPLDSFLIILAACAIQSALFAKRAAAERIWPK